MPTIFQTKDKSGRPHPKFRFKFIDYLGKRRTMTGTTSRKETTQLANQIQAEHDAIRKGWRPPPKPSDTPRPFQEVCDEYLAWGMAQGGHHGRPWSSTHNRQKRNKLAFWKDRLGLSMLSDLVGSLARVEAVLRDLKNNGRSGKTVSNYAEVIASFCDWSVEREYLAEDPLKRLKKFDTTPQTQRRALTADEIVRLLTVAPPQRRLLYEVALASGLRVRELRLLVVSDFDLFACGLRLRPEVTKNRKAGFQPLPGWLTQKLAEHIACLEMDDRLLRVPSNPASSMHRDCRKAGILRWTAEGKIDFHSLRTTYATMVIEAGASVKEAQTLARHSTPGLTLNVYARSRSERLNELAESVGTVIQGQSANCPADVQQRQGSDSNASQPPLNEGVTAGQEAGALAGSNPAVSGFQESTTDGRITIICGQFQPQIPYIQQVGSMDSAKNRTLSGFIGLKVG